MRQMLTAAALIAALGAPGCHVHEDDHDTDIVVGGAWYITYGNGHPIAASTTDPFILSRESDLLSYVNNHRVSMGVAALIDSGAMRDVARAHSIHMSIGDFTGLVNPEGDDPGDRADIAGIAWSIYAENIEYDWSDPYDVYLEWLASPGMHANIDDPDFVYAGVGYEHESESIWNDYWTMDFRRP